MRVRALRGVCIGVERHLKKDDVADIEPSLHQFLSSIGAVEDVPEPKPEPPKAEPKPADPKPDLKPKEK